MRYQSLNRNTFSNCFNFKSSDTLWIILIVNILLLSDNIISTLETSAGGTLKTNDCPNSIDHCSKDMRTILNDTRFTFAQNDHQLDILCSHLNRSITCINKFIECDSMATLKKDSIIPMLHLMDKLCSKSSKFRIEYLKHAECYHRLAPVYEKCYQLYYISEQKRIELHRNITDVQHLMLWCCNYKNHRKCTSDPVRRACGSEATNLAEQIVIISQGQDALNNCPKNIISTTACLTHWDSLGLLVNTTYRKDGNMEFLTNEGNFLYPDRISTSGSSSSMLIQSTNIKSAKSLLEKLFSSTVTSLIQLMTFTVIISIYSNLDVINSLTIRLPPSPIDSASSSPSSSSSQLPASLPLSSSSLTSTWSWSTTRSLKSNSLMPSLVIKTKASQSKT